MQSSICHWRGELRQLFDSDKSCNDNDDNINIVDSEGELRQPMNPNGELVLLLSSWGEEPAIKMKRGQAAQKFHPVNGHKFVAKVLSYSKNSFDWPVRAGFQ